MILRVFLAGLLATFVTLTVGGGSAHACRENDAFCTDTGTDGASVLLSQDVKRLGNEQSRAKAANEPYFVYKTIDACGPGGSKSFEECHTNRVSLMCPDGDGPLSDIKRRLMKPDGTPADGAAGQWRSAGSTCRGNEVPGADPRPSMAMIVEAFHHTSWAKASVGFQPAGDLTLVNLPSYFEAKWSASGFGPGEVDSVDPAEMFGHRVQIRPKVVGFTYHFGDGASEGPTSSAGGTYPEGDIRHTYTRKGSYAAHITVRWGADFRVDDGAWQEIPDTVTVDQPATTITVKEARARLIR